MLVTGSCRATDKLMCPNCGHSFCLDKRECPQCHVRIVVIRKRRKSVHPYEERVPENTDGYL